VRIGSGPERSIEDLTVELRTLDGKTLISSVKSQNMGFYMLPLKGAPWREYPVGCRIRLVVDGKPLGQDAVIECSGLSGLYPDSVYDVVLR
jgi:hypothetical protein